MLKPVDSGVRNGDYKFSSLNFTQYGAPMKASFFQSGYLKCLETICSSVFHQILFLEISLHLPGNCAAKKSVLTSDVVLEKLWNYNRKLCYVKIFMEFL